MTVSVQAMFIAGVKAGNIGGSVRRVFDYFDEYD